MNNYSDYMEELGIENPLLTPENMEIYRIILKFLKERKDRVGDIFLGIKKGNIKIDNLVDKVTEDVSLEYALSASQIIQQVGENFSVLADKLPDESDKDVQKMELLRDLVKDVINGELRKDNLEDYIEEWDLEEEGFDKVAKEILKIKNEEELEKLLEVLENIIEINFMEVYEEIYKFEEEARNLEYKEITIDDIREIIKSLKEIGEMVEDLLEYSRKDIGLNSKKILETVENLGSDNEYMSQRFTPDELIKTGRQGSFDFYDKMKKIEYDVKKMRGGGLFTSEDGSSIFVKNKKVIIMERGREREFVIKLQKEELNFIFRKNPHKIKAVLNHFSIEDIKDINSTMDYYGREAILKALGLIVDNYSNKNSFVIKSMCLPENPASKKEVEGNSFKASPNYIVIKGMYLENELEINKEINNIIGNNKKLLNEESRRVIREIVEVFRLNRPKMEHFKNEMKRESARINRIKGEIKSAKEGEKDLEEYKDRFYKFVLGMLEEVKIRSLYKKEMPLELHNNGEDDYSLLITFSDYEYDENGVKEYLANSWCLNSNFEGYIDNEFKVLLTIGDKSENMYDGIVLDVKNMRVLYGYDKNNCEISEMEQNEKAFKVVLENFEEFCLRIKKETGLEKEEIIKNMISARVDSNLMLNNLLINVLENNKEIVENSDIIQSALVEVASDSNLSKFIKEKDIRLIENILKNNLKDLNATVKYK